MTHLRHHTTGNRASWQFDRRPMDANLRRMIHGPVLPLQEASLWAKLWGKG